MTLIQLFNLIMTLFVTFKFFHIEILLKYKNFVNLQIFELHGIISLIDIKFFY